MPKNSGTAVLQMATVAIVIDEADGNDSGLLADDWNLLCTRQVAASPGNCCPVDVNGGQRTWEMLNPRFAPTTNR